MSEIKDGGPAYPVHAVYQDCGIDGNSGPHLTESIHAGMTLRDYFAAKAMQGIVSHSDTWGYSSAAGICEAAYRIADKMLKAREVQS